MSNPIDVMNDAVEQYNDYLEKELRGAWRAGYDYLHVYEEPPQTQHAPDDLEKVFNLRRCVYPANEGQRRPDPPQLRYIHSFDLKSVPDEVIRNALNDQAMIPYDDL